MYATPRSVGDVMTRTVAVVGPETPFKEIARMLRDRHVGSLPVLVGGRVAGVVSESDLLPKEELRDAPGEAYTGRRRPADLAKAEAATAAELMSAPAVTVHSGATLAEAARRMARSGVRMLPVVDDKGVLEGVVSRVDLLKVFLRGDQDIEREVRHDIVSWILPPPDSLIHVEVHDGVVTLTGSLRDTALVPVAARLVRAVEGVVDVEFDLAPAPGRADGTLT
ncbi:CBS domain-containing protein [Streptomyces sp. SID4985]|uniref:CBS domain-containing protein n=1 Tax=unclassified Streptomyces TaxID=2593676 RepID=UPI0013691984|nr:CBS domain-containing protein [Streptomyces sp. SID4985]MYQ43608.1 CBS domain-containing protein [Streptomyces sp. SID4985]